MCSRRCSSGDEDSDGVIDGEDECPGTAIGAAVDSDGCSQEQLSQDNKPYADTDGDCVIDSEDECADTPPNTATDSKGCSGKQNQQKSTYNSEGGSSSSGLNFMIILITLGAIVFGGALFFLLRNPNEDDGAMKRGC